MSCVAMSCVPTARSLDRSCRLAFVRELVFSYAHCAWGRVWRAADGEHCSIAMSLTSLANLVFPKLVAVLVDGMAKSEPPRRRFLASALLIFAGGAVGSWLRTYLFALANESVTTRLRVKLVKRILLQDMPFFDRTRKQDLVVRVTEDAQVALAPPPSLSLSKARCAAGCFLARLPSCSLALSLCLPPPPSPSLSDGRRAGRSIRRDGQPS